VISVKDRVCGWLLEWFSQRGKIAAESAAGLPEINYFDAGMLTSLEIVEFVSEIEEKFGVQFSESDFQDPRFLTISGLSELILERREQTSDSAQVALHDPR
jgi:acyl carrier protein